MFFSKKCAEPTKHVSAVNWCFCPWEAKIKGCMSSFVMVPLRSRQCRLMRKSLRRFDLLVRCLIFFYKETNKPKKPCDSPSNTDFGDCPHAVIWHKCDVLCFATGTFACTARGQSLQNQIEKICFLHFSITSYLTQEPISHTTCQSKGGEKKSSAEDGNKDASCWH